MEAKATTTTTKKANANGMSKKTLANIKKQATAFIGGFRAACVAILEVANAGDKDAKKLCAYLGINAESVKNKNIKETRTYILDRLPLYYTVEGSESRFPARLQKVSSDMIEAGVQKGYIAVKDTFLNSLITLGGLLSKENKYTQVELSLTESASVGEMSIENTTCIVYDRDATRIGDATDAYIRYRAAKAAAAKKAKTAGEIAYADALK